MTPGIATTTKKNLQKLWCGEKGTSSQVHGVFVHEEEVEVTHQVPRQFIHKTAAAENNTETMIHI